MIGQATVKQYNETADPVTGEGTSGEPDARRMEYRKIIEDWSITKQHECAVRDTAYTNAEVTDLFPFIAPRPQPARDSFAVLQEWEGCVVSISNETFTARLTDLTGNGMAEGEEADFPLDDLTDADRSRISEGSIFRWVVGYRRSPSGTKDRLSRIVFRNLPAWTTKEFKKNRQEAAEWASHLRVE
jgi:hypothetical protein